MGGADSHDRLHEAVARETQHPAAVGRLGGMGRTSRRDERVTFDCWASNPTATASPTARVQAADPREVGQRRCVDPVSKDGNQRNGGQNEP